MVGTAADYLRFAQMLLNGGELDGVRILSEESVRNMTSDQLGPEFGEAPLVALKVAASSMEYCRLKLWLGNSVPSISEPKTKLPIWKSMPNLPEMAALKSSSLKPVGHGEFGLKVGLVPVNAPWATELSPL